MSGGSVEYTCEYCGKTFCGTPSRGKSKHICCSRECAALLIKSRNDLNCVCPVCGKHFHRKQSFIDRYKSHCCSRECLKIKKHADMYGDKNHQFGLKGRLNSSWKSDEKINDYGYRMIRVLNHPFATKSGFVCEHRLVAEKYLLTDENSIEIDGVRYLKPELHVHHIDKNRLNNDPSNLVVLTQKEHSQIHNKTLWREASTGRIARKKEMVNMEKVFVRRSNPEAKLPTKAHSADAGWDLYSVDEYVIEPGQTVKVDTGLNFSLPTGTFGAIYARSGLATNSGLRPANCVGVCDSGYTNNYIVPLYNDSNTTRVVHKHDRIAQLIIQNYVDVSLEETDHLEATERGADGFGSSGT